MNNKPPVFQNPQADGGHFFWPGKKDNNTAILLFHGFTATTIEVRPMAKYLSGLGYTVVGPLLPGHGVSPDELNHTHYFEWIGAAELVYDELAQQFDNIFVMGESMGGLLSLWLASEHPEIKGIVLFAPAMKIPRLWQANLVWPFVTMMYKKNIDLTSTWQGFNVIPMRAAAQLNRLQNHIRRHLEDVTQPAVIFQGKLDTTIDPLGAVDVLEGISSVDKQLVWLEESTHCILLDKQMDIVEKITSDFLTDHE